MKTQTEILLTEEVLANVDYLLQSMNEEHTLPEMAEDQNVPFLTLLNRMGEEQVEEVMSKLLNAHSELREYNNHPLSDIPPG